MVQTDLSENTESELEHDSEYHALGAASAVSGAFFCHFENLAMKKTDYCNSSSFWLFPDMQTITLQDEQMCSHQTPHSVHESLQESDSGDLEIRKNSGQCCKDDDLKHE